MRHVSVDIDLGGTFTDGFFADSDRHALVKVDTTPHDLTVCFWGCLEAGAEAMGYADVKALLADTKVIRFATTVGTNAILQATGAKLGAVVASGQEEALYAPDGGRSPLLGRFLSPDLVIGIPEPLVDVSESVVRDAIRQLLDRGARRVVVSLPHARAGELAERRVRKIVRSLFPEHFLGSVPILLSSEVRPRPDDFTRTNVAVINAYLHRDLASDLYRAEDRLRDGAYRYPLLITHSSGGAARVAKTRAIDTYNSGPVAGLFGSSRFARAYGLPRVVSADIGGTSTDLGLIVEAEPRYNFRSEIARVPVHLPYYQVDSIAAGGGSIARVTGRELSVGPASAGAVPGPVAYGMGGTEPTVTDACLVLGYLDAGYFLGGRRPLDREAAEHAISERLAAPLGIGPEEAALAVWEAIARSVATSITSLIAPASPGRWALFAFGGCGGLFAGTVADRIVADAYLFHTGAVFNAFGSSAMDVAHLYEHPVGVRVADVRSHDLAEILESLAEHARRDMRGEGLDTTAVRFRLELELAHGTDVEMARVEASSAWEESLGRTLAAIPRERELRALRLIAEAAMPHAPLATAPTADSDPSAARKGTREIVLAGGSFSALVYAGERLLPGHRIEGPALVDNPDSTTLVPSDHTLEIDGFHNGIMRRIEAA